MLVVSGVIKFIVRIKFVKSCYLLIVIFIV